MKFETSENSYIYFETQAPCSSSVGLIQTTKFKNYKAKIKQMRKPKKGNQQLKMIISSEADILVPITKAHRVNTKYPNIIIYIPKTLKTKLC